MYEIRAITALSQPLHSFALPGNPAGLFLLSSFRLLLEPFHHCVFT